MNRQRREALARHLSEKAPETCGHPRHLVENGAIEIHTVAPRKRQVNKKGKTELVKGEGKTYETINPSVREEKAARRSDARKTRNAAKTPVERKRKTKEPK